jgi:hypothetical protein
MVEAASYPPLQRTQERGTHCFRTGRENTEARATRPVTETKEGVSVVSSSENALRPAVRAALKEGEVAAKGAGHAEVTGVNAAKQMGLTPTGVAASRGICPSCAQFLRDVGVAALSALRGMPF